MRDIAQRAVSATAAAWSRRTPPQALAVAVALALLAGGLFHVGVYAVDGGPWSGPIGWRKPITFGLSFGATLLSFAWIASYVPLSRRAEWWILGPLAVASAAEYGLITLQAWRGVPSHFNVATGLDATVWVAMGVGIGVIVLATIALTAAAFRRVHASPSVGLAIRAGLVLLLVGYAAGGAIIGAGGGATVAPSGDESIVGPAGELKVPHGLGLHALQALPLLAGLLSLGSAPERTRVRLVGLATAAWSLLLAAQIVQALTGEASYRLGILAGGLVLMAFLAFAAAVVLALRALQPAAGDRAALQR
jgi:hypothetical protein